MTERARFGLPAGFSGAFVRLAADQTSNAFFAAMIDFQAANYVFLKIDPATLAATKLASTSSVYPAGFLAVGGNLYDFARGQIQARIPEN